LLLSLTLSPVLSGNTALLEACREDRLESVKGLVASGSDLTRANRHGQIALEASVDALCVSLCVTLFCNPAFVTLPDPIQVARESQYDSCALWLQQVMTEGARKVVLHERRQREAEAGERFRRASILSPLAAHQAAEEEQEARDLTNALIQVSLRGNHHELKAILEKKADPAAVRESDGTSALLWAARLARHSVLEVMAQAGTPMDAEVGTGKTALGEACAWGLPETVKCLVSLHADLNHETATGATPLCTAIEFGQKEVCHALIQAQASVNILPRDGETPLCTAIRVEEADLVTALIEANADPEAENSKGVTAVRLASELGVEAVVLAVTEGMAKDKKGTPPSLPLV